VTGGKPTVRLIAVFLRWEYCYPLVAFYDIHGKKGEVLFFSSVPDTTHQVQHETVRLMEKDKKYVKKR
jgi:hypothetical protein